MSDTSGSDHRNREAVATGLALAAELARVTALLENSGIRSIALKGPALAAQLYGCVTGRETLDLDILITPRDVPAAVDILARAGYVADDAFRDVAASGYELGLRSPRSVIDLHWQLSPPERRLPCSTDAVLGRAEIIRVCGRPIRVLSAMDLCLYLCVHAAQHCWSDPKWIRDIAQFIRVRKDLNWRIQIEEARRCRCLRRIAVAAILARELFEAPLPDALAAVADSDTRARAVADRIQEMLVRGGLHSEMAYRSIEAAARDSWTDGIGYWVRFLRWRARPTEADRRIVRLPPCCSCLYYAIRAARLACAPALSRFQRQGSAPASPLET